MEKFNRILLQVWREACRDIEIEKSCAVISSMLLQHLPLHQVLVGGVDQAKKNAQVLLIVLSNPDAMFSPDHRQILRLLLEPFSIALHNDLKLREINVL